jgi:hypothetical protein
MDNNKLFKIYRSIYKNSDGSSGKERPIVVLGTKNNEYVVYNVAPIQSYRPRYSKQHQNLLTFNTETNAINDIKQHPILQFLFLCNV